MEDSLSDAPIRKHMHEVTRSELGATIHTRQECDPGTLARRTDQNPEVSRRESRFKVDRLLLTGILRECPNARSRLFLLMKDWKTHEIGRCGGLARARPRFPAPVAVRTRPPASGAASVTIT